MTICYFTGHRWNSAGICRRCRLICSHPVTIYERDLHRTRCLDCGLVTPGNGPFATRPVMPRDPLAETAWHHLTDTLSGIFHKDEGPFA